MYFNYTPSCVHIIIQSNIYCKCQWKLEVTPGLEFSTGRSAKYIRRRGRRGRDSGNALEAGDAMQSNVLSLISSAPTMPVIVNC